MIEKSTIFYYILCTDLLFNVSQRILRKGRKVFLSLGKSQIQGIHGFIEEFFYQIAFMLE